MTPIKKCDIPTCQHHILFALGMCKKHYQEWIEYNNQQSAASVP